jgi:hypothetical protein
MLASGPLGRVCVPTTSRYGYDGSEAPATPVLSWYVTRPAIGWFVSEEDWILTEI